MHGQRDIGIMTAAHTLERGESGIAQVLLKILLVLRLRLRLVLRLRLDALLELSNSWAINRAGWECPRLESATVKAWTIGVETLADNLPTTNNNRTVTVVKRRQLGLSEAKGEIDIVTSRHVESQVIRLLSETGYA